MKPGDIYVTNDSYTTGSHLNHFTFTLPIFHKGKLAGFSCCMAHWLDVGGVLGGMTTDIYSEGIQIPILKYQDRGKVNQDLLDIIRMNVRLPPRAMGDLRAQITAVKTGERRFLELLDRYGHQAVMDSIAEIMDRAEAAARARTKTIPDGVYEAESWLDDDGIDIGKRIPVKVKVTVKGDEMTIDLTEVSKQVRGFYNSGDHDRLWLRAGRLQVHHLADRLSDQRRRVPEPEGHHPAGPHRQRDAARADALVDDVSDDHHRHHLQGAAAGDPGPRHRRPSRRPRRAELPRLQSEDVGVLHRHLRPARRRLGREADRGRRVGDGLHQRRRHPQRPERAGRGEIPDPGGALRAHSGLRRRREAPRRARHRAHHARAHPLSRSTRRASARPVRPGASTAAARPPATRSRSALGNEWKTDFPNAKVLVAQLKPGDAFRISSGGGGGYGAPFERPVEDVREDVRQGYVTAKAAAERYGVVVDPETFAIDQAATDRLRAGQS